MFSVMYWGGLYAFKQYDKNQYSNHDDRLKKRLLKTESPLSGRSQLSRSNLPRENNTLFLSVSCAYVKHAMAQRRPCNDVGSVEGGLDTPPEVRVMSKVEQPERAAQRDSINSV
jgi:hypothetical protein